MIRCFQALICKCRYLYSLVAWVTGVETLHSGFHLSYSPDEQDVVECFSVKRWRMYRSLHFVVCGWLTG